MDKIQETTFSRSWDNGQGRAVTPQKEESHQVSATTLWLQATLDHSTGKASKQRTAASGGGGERFSDLGKLSELTFIRKVEDGWWKSYRKQVLEICTKSQKTARSAAESKRCQSRTPQPARISFKNEGVYQERMNRQGMTDSHSEILLSNKKEPTTQQHRWPSTYSHAYCTVLWHEILEQARLTWGGRETAVVSGSRGNDNKDLCILSTGAHTHVQTRGKSREAVTPHWPKGTLSIPSLASKVHFPQKWTRATRKNSCLHNSAEKLQETLRISCAKQGKKLLKNNEDMLKGHRRWSEETVKLRRILATKWIMTAMDYKTPKQVRIHEGAKLIRVLDGWMSG